MNKVIETLSLGKGLAMNMIARFLGAGIVVGVAAQGANAETLKQALAHTYLDNPKLQASRAQLRSTDELVPQALSGWRPTVTANGDYSYKYREQGNDSDDSSSSFSVTLSQPLFKGFGTVSATRSAEANVESGRANLLNVEQSVLLEGIKAYMNVVRDRKIADFRQSDVNALREKLRSTKAKFEVGEVTRTDIAQARSSLSQSLSLLSQANADLSGSVANYVHVVGYSPGRLVHPSLPSSLLPKTLHEAIEIGSKDNPLVRKAHFTEQASRYAVDTEKSNLLPNASLEAIYNWKPNQTNHETVSISGKVTVPLYKGGLNYSKIRQAKHTNSQNRLDLLNTQREVRETIVKKWNTVSADKEKIHSTTDQVEAEKLAYDGIVKEAEAGTRTTLDVLNAEKDLVDARIDMVKAHYDHIISAYELVAAMGRLTASQLGLPVSVYDPTVNSRRVRNKLFGTGINDKGNRDKEPR